MPSEEENSAAESEEVVEEVVEVQEEGTVEQTQEQPVESNETGKVVQSVRQDYQSKIDNMERDFQYLRQENERLRTQQPKVEEEDDSEEIITRGELRNAAAGWQKQSVESSWMSSNTDRVNAIKEHLPEVLKKKPWLASVIESAPNRYEQASEIVEMYSLKEKDVGKRVIDNSRKPVNPSGIAKSGGQSNAERLRNMSSSEFRKYRSDLLKKR